jgi:hypothetical protein
MVLWFAMSSSQQSAFALRFGDQGRSERLIVERQLGELLLQFAIFTLELTQLRRAFLLIPDSHGLPPVKGPDRNTVLFANFFHFTALMAFVKDPSTFALRES